MKRINETLILGLVEDIKSLPEVPNTKQINAFVNNKVLSYIAHLNISCYVELENTGLHRNMSTNYFINM